MYAHPPWFRLGAFILLAAACTASDGGKAAPSPGNWAVYGSDKASTKSTRLDHITAANFKNLTTAWTWETVDQPILAGDTALWTGRYEATPLAIDGVLYTTTSLSQAVAIDGATGKTLWTYDPGTWREGPPPNVTFVHRGLTYWKPANGSARLFYGTGSGYLIALDPATGKPIPEFGQEGKIDLTQGVRSIGPSTASLRRR